MREVILLLSADIDIQSAFERYEEYQEGRGVAFLRQLDCALRSSAAFLKADPQPEKTIGDFWFRGFRMAFSTTSRLAGS